MTTIETELTLADQFQQEFQMQDEVLLLETVAQQISGPQKADSLSLPAALCDDKLLEELKSIPDKMGFKIGEVAEMLGIKQYVLRYWESEFDILNPKKAANNQRYFTRKDVENAFIIRKLLHRDRFSIEGARSAMTSLKSFAKKEVKRDLELTKFQTRFETFHDQVDDLIIEIRNLKSIFA
jgi:DNA-binding transcriptional MerR regulator